MASAPVTTAPYGPGPTRAPVLPPEPTVRHHPIGTAPLDVGIFKNTIVPSFKLHSGLSAAAYVVGRVTNRLDTKDWLWPTGQVANAWWSAVGRHLVGGASLSSVWKSMNRTETLLLTGVTLWGGRLFYRVAERSIERGHDDPRYEAAKEDPGFWNKAFFTVYLPEAFFQTIIALPFTVPFRHQAIGSLLAPSPEWFNAAAVGLFGAGFALEILADWQLGQFKKSIDNADDSMCKDGVWSIVRHPNYLGDALIHFSFPLLLYATGMLSPLELLGPLANYVFLRYVGGDKENEESQEARYLRETPKKKIDLDRYRQQKNSFWPNRSAVANKWTWTVIGCGLAGAVLEKASRWAR
ncbi:hypothetical protein CGLO_03841 [Colletotrichum gloeosporioides Cg-14]|uniref:Steroid 5-alpha reductase C-terminal domain-containing protein n=1 Tax=Colletotrichum gloeosporioides (strain Cg-14) TaxID=1237896 RepID=T0KVN0_COLGC|nr:hypothetical protein CGLO_03841 [Colletotrichum gloeosporioides Cg-14]